MKAEKNGNEVETAKSEEDHARTLEQLKIKHRTTIEMNQEFNNNIADNFLEYLLKLAFFANCSCKRKFTGLTDAALSKAHPAVPGWSICSIRVACADDRRRAGGDMGWLGRDR
jgi:hypothetical protein